MKKSDKGKKRSRDDDVPPNATVVAYKLLDQHTKCEAHDGNCFVDRPQGRDSHRRLNYQQLEFWAKKIVSVEGKYIQMFLTHT